MWDLNYSISSPETDQDEIPLFDLPENRCSSPYLQDISNVSLSEYIKDSQEVDTSVEIIYSQTWL